MLRKFFKKARQIARDEQGISAVEYAILGALVAVGIATAASTLGSDIKTAIEDMSKAITGEQGTP
ncbi:Flp family type IVb pilin [Inquilinus limosus]|uniref:Flp family type IVb pilin n=1 Tax=Inquilinus limosus TaxID=171674 RepID=UPI00040512F6|nr:Flp family type IVb pilin [Inquilinus limosus]